MTKYNKFCTTTKTNSNSTDNETLEEENLKKPAVISAST
jgi:hypothetical protein